MATGMPKKRPRDQKNINRNSMKSLPFEFWHTTGSRR